MTDGERLVGLIIEAKRTDPETGSFTDYLADYLLEHGVIVPPCKVGDKVYYIEMCRTAEDWGKLYISWGEVKQLSFNKRGKWLILIDNAFFDCREIGTVAFLTREEAEKALKEREDNG